MLILLASRVVVRSTRHPMCSFGRNEVTQDLGALGGPDSFPALGCNNQRDDLVAGSSFLDSTPHADTGLPTLDPFLWQNGTMKDLGTLGGTFGYSQCANNRGHVIGQSSLTGAECFTGAGDCHAFFWNGVSLKDLGTLGGSFSIPFWLNDTGKIVGGATTPNDEFFHATLWQAGGITDLGTLPGDCFSVAFAINSKEQIVGWSAPCDFSTQHGVIWDMGKIIELNVALGESDINDRGEIAGVGLPNGCDDFDACGHEFVLIPCDPTAVRTTQVSLRNPQLQL
jgi:probable HAF family extracellular repeat protein